MDPCRARDTLYPSAHTCSDPAACALDNLGPLEDTEAERLHALLDRIAEACEVSKAKVAQAVMQMIHAERAGVRDDPA